MLDTGSQQHTICSLPAQRPLLRLSDGRCAASATIGALPQRRSVRCLSANGNPIIQHKNKKERLMKTTLHYIIAILLLSLNATYVFAEEEIVGPFKIIDKGEYVSCTYDKNNNLLTISGSGSLTITGDGEPINAGIVLAEGHGIILTIKDLHIQAAAPLKVEEGDTSFSLTLQGTNILESTANESLGIEIIGSQNFTINGPGSLTAIGGNIDGDNENGNR